MRQDQISYEHAKIINKVDHSSGGSLIFGFIFFSVVMIGGMIYIPMILNDLWMFGFIAFIILGTLIRYHVSSTSNEREFFDDADNHTHGNNCFTCGNIFGPKHKTCHPYVIRTAFKCRHAIGKMDYPI